MAQILVVDDEKGIREMLCMHLSLAGHQCHDARDAAQARLLLSSEQIDLALLDVLMPGEDGFSLAEAFVKRGIPVVFLTAKTAVTDRVKGLKLGADDYIVKPFEPAELLARIEGILKRSAKEQPVYEDASIRVDYAARLVQRAGETISLTALEYELLSLLTQNEGRAINRETLLARVWGYDFAGETRTVDVHIQRLRSKIGAAAIETVYKYGYRYKRVEKA